MLRRPPRSTLFPTRRSSDLRLHARPRDREAVALQPERRHEVEVVFEPVVVVARGLEDDLDRKSTRLNSSHTVISYAVFCLKKKKYEICRATVDKRFTRLT